MMLCLAINFTSLQYASSFADIIRSSSQCDFLKHFNYQFKTAGAFPQLISSRCLVLVHFQRAFGYKCEKKLWATSKIYCRAEFFKIIKTETVKWWMNNSRLKPPFPWNSACEPNANMSSSKRENTTHINNIRMYVCAKCVASIRLQRSTNKKIRTRIFSVTKESKHRKSCILPVYKPPHYWQPDWQLLEGVEEDYLKY